MSFSAATLDSCNPVEINKNHGRRGWPFLWHRLCVLFHVRGPARGKEVIKTLLVVNDSETERSALASYFRASGFRVLEASSTDEGIASVVNQSINVVIMKAQMPGLSGLDAAPIIKRLRPEIQVFLTAPRDFHGPGETTRHVNFFTCFEEPLDLERIKGVIESS